MTNRIKLMAAVLGGSTNLNHFKKKPKMTASKIIVSNYQLRGMAEQIVEAAKPEICGTERSIRLMSIPFCPTVTFYENPIDSSTRVEVWVNKEKISEQSYSTQSSESWSTLDTRLEINTQRGLVKYFYKLLLDSNDLRAVIADAMQAGNKTVKLPNGQTLTSEILHRPRDLSVGLRQTDNYPVFSAPVDATEDAVDHILANISYHWTDPGILAPGDHYIEIPSEAFGE